MLLVGGDGGINFEEGFEVFKFDRGIDIDGECATVFGDHCDHFVSPLLGAL